MKILVPVDGSRYSDESLRVAADYAKGKGAQICLINVAPLYEDIDLEISASTREELSDRLLKRAEEVMNQAQKVLSEEGITAVCSEIVQSSAIAESIIQYSEQESIDLIIMGSRGLSPSSRFKLGSVSSSVVKHAPCSVYVVKIK
jgi:nucleotide-binding universal stress UspA family protein